MTFRSAQEETEIEYWEGTWTKERFKAVETPDTSKVLSIFWNQHSYLKQRQQLRFEWHPLCLVFIPSFYFFLLLTIIKHDFPGTSLAVQWLRLHLQMQLVRGRSLVGEIRSYMPRGKKKKKIKKQKQYSIKTLKNCPHQRKILKNKKHDLSKASPFIYPPNIIDIYWSCHTRIQKIIRHILVLSQSLLSLNPFWNFKKVVTLNLKIAVTNKLQISHYVQQEFINKQTQSLTGYCLYTNDLINQYS